MLTRAQAERLSVGAYRQMSPHLENCCLRISANVSYAQACDDICYLTGMRVPAKTQQRLVQSYDFAQPELPELEEISVDGGKVRLRTPVGEPCQWKDYKAVASETAVVARYQQNDELAEWVNQQPLATPLTCCVFSGLRQGGNVKFGSGVTENFGRAMQTIINGKKEAEQIKGSVYFQREKDSMTSQGSGEDHRVCW